MSFGSRFWTSRRFSLLLLIRSMRACRGIKDAWLRSRVYGSVSFELVECSRMRV